MIDNPPELPPYQCEQIVFRAQLYKEWVKNGKVKKQAFYRLNKDEHGISVSSTEESCGEGLTDPIHGKLTLHIGRIRTLGLDVIPDTPTHGNIQDIPTREENDALARTLAEDLADMARPLAE
ncbi:MAG: hypothetical protein ACREA9_08420 [Pyrinomonadaceae bacterium]